MGGFDDGRDEQPHPGFRDEGGLPRYRDVLTIPCDVLSLPTRTADGSAILVNAEHCMGLRKEGYKRQAQVVEVPESGRGDDYLLLVQSSQQQKVSIPRRVMQALYTSGIIAPCTPASTPTTTSTHTRTRASTPSGAGRPSTEPLASQPPPAAPRSRPGLLLPSSITPPASTLTTASPTARGGGAVARAPVTATDAKTRAELSERERRVNEREKAFVQMDEHFMAQMEQLSTREAKLSGREHDVAEVQAVLDREGKQLEERERRLQAREKAVEDRDKRLAGQQRDRALQLDEVKAQMERVVASERAAKERARALELELHKAKDQDGAKAVHLAGLVKELEAAREEAADLRARLPGLLHLRSVVQDRDATINALQARLAEVERERDEEREEGGQRQAEGESREAELRATLEDRDAAIELLTLQVDRQERDVLTLHEQMEALEREHALEIEQLRRECEETQSQALAALEEQHLITMAEQQQAHDEEKRRLGDKLTAMEAYSESLAVELRELKERDWVEVVAMPASKAPSDAGEDKGEGSH